MSFLYDLKDLVKKAKNPLLSQLREDIEDVARRGGTQMCVNPHLYRAEKIDIFRFCETHGLSAKTWEEDYVRISWKD